MLQAIRDGSKGIVAKTVVGLIILSFTLFGVVTIVDLGMGEDAPAEVNGEEITLFEVEQMARMQIRRMQAQFGSSFNLDEERMRSMALDNLINEKVMTLTAKDAGVLFSNQQIDTLIASSPEFQVDGKFSAAQFDMVLASAGFTRQTYRELLRNSLMTRQVQSSWQLSSFTTPVEVDVVKQLDAQTRDIAFTVYSLEAEKKSASVSTDEAKSYYDANQGLFMTEDAVKVDYVELTREQIAGDIEVSEEDIADRYAELKYDADSKKEYRAAHIMLMDASDDSKQKLVDAKKAIEDGKSFEELAKELSDDDLSKFAGGDLGFASLEVYEPEFADAVSSLEVNQISDVVQTRDGLHLIKLNEVRTPALGSLDDMKETIRETLVGEQLQGLYIERLEGLKDQAFANDGLEAVAQNLELELKSSGVLTQNSRDGLAQYPAVIEAAFSEQVLNDGMNSEVIEVEDGKAVVIHINTFTPSKVKPFGEVESSIVAMLTQQKAEDAIEVKASAELAAVQGGEADLNWEIKKAVGRQTQGVDPSILASAFEIADTDRAAKLVSLQNGDRAIVKVLTIQRDNPVAEESGAKQKAERVRTFNEQKAFEKYAFETSEIERN